MSVLVSSIATAVYRYPLYIYETAATAANIINDEVDTSYG